MLLLAWKELLTIFSICAERLQRGSARYVRRTINKDCILAGEKDNWYESYIQCDSVRHMIVNSKEYNIECVGKSGLEIFVYLES